MRCLTSSEGGSGTFSHLGVFSVQDGKAATLGVRRSATVCRCSGSGTNRARCCSTSSSPAPTIRPAARRSCRARPSAGRTAGCSRWRARSSAGCRSTCWPPRTGCWSRWTDSRCRRAPCRRRRVIQYGKAAGFSGCNRYTGPITESAPGNVKLGELAVTRKACDAAANEIEAAFLDRMRASDLVLHSRRAGCCWSRRRTDEPPRTLAVFALSRRWPDGQTRSAGRGRFACNELTIERLLRSNP